MASDKVSKIVDQIKDLTVVEAFELKKSLEEEFGVEAAAPMAMMAAAPAAAAEPEEEKTEFDLMLNSFGEKKVDVIKAVKALTGLGLKEAKELVEAAPSKVLEAVSKEKAEESLAQLKDAGADAEVK